MVRRDAASTERRISMSKSAKKSSPASKLPVVAAKPSLTARWRYQEHESRPWLQAISRHRDAAITHGGNDCRDDEDHGLAAALGARLPCRRGAQAPQAEARLEESRRQPGLPDREREQRQDEGSPSSTVGPERHAARQDRSCPAGPERARRRDRALARSRRRRASGPLAQRLSAASPPSPAPPSAVSRSGLPASGRTAGRPGWRESSACSIARRLPRTPDSAPWT